MRNAIEWNHLNQVLPISTKFVTSASDFFEYYEAMEYEQWCRMIPRILERTVGYRKRSETLRQMYEDTLTPLKQRQDYVRLVVTELKELKDEFEREKRELEDTASTKRGWAIGLAFVPFVNLIATPALASSAQSDIDKAVTNGAQAAIQEAAARKVSDTMLPALQAFVSGITKAAGFFSVMEQELRKFEGKAEKGKDTQKRLHYRVMKLEAGERYEIHLPNLPYSTAKSKERFISHGREARLFYSDVESNSSWKGLVRAFIPFD